MEEYSSITAIRHLLLSLSLCFYHNHVKYSLRAEIQGILICYESNRSKFDQIYREKYQHLTHQISELLYFLMDLIIFI